MKKKRLLMICGAAALALCAALCFILLRSPGPGGSYENLIQNGDFELLNESGLPTGWYTDAYIYQNYTLFSSDQGLDGHGAHIENKNANDARFAQAAAVSPDTLYCLRGFIRADAEGGLGANLSIEGVYVFSESVYQTDGEWQEVALYGKTGPKQRSVTVYARLGGYSGEATGEAGFDNVTLCRVDSVPGGYYAVNWYKEEAAPVQEETTRTGAMQLILCCTAYALLFLGLWRLIKRPEALKTRAKGQELLQVALLLLLAAAARMLVAALVPGYDVDIGCFRAWATQMAQSGPVDFYQSVSFCDYPPGYLWILWLLGLIGRALGGVSEWLVKIPSVAADITLCALLYKSARARGHREALALCLLYAFNPLTFAAGAAWGQTDALMTLLVFLAVDAAGKKRWKTALPCYAVAVLVKPQALLFGPLGLGALIAQALWTRKDKPALRALLKDAALGLAATAVACAAIALPFAWKQSPDWLFSLYAKTMGSYGYATVNGCNLYFLFGENWVGSVEPLSAPLVLCAAALLLLPCLCYALPRFRAGAEKARPAEEKKFCLIALGIAAATALTVAVLALLGALTYSSLSTCFIAGSIALAFFLYAWGKAPDNLALLGAAQLMLLFAAGSMMHERYLFPAVALLLLAYVRKRDKRILYLALGVTLTGLLNVGCVLDRNIRIGGADGHLNAPAFGIASDMSVLEYLAAAGNCLLAMAALSLSLRLCGGEEPARVPAAKANSAAEQNKAVAAAPLPQNAPLRKMTRRDWVLMLCCTVLYAALAFTNLGSTKAPQHAWVSTDANEQIVLDLGAEKQFHMLYYGGIHQYDSDFTVETSADGQSWARAYSASMKIGECFKWQYLCEPTGSSLPAALNGRYVRITADHISLTLFEAIFRDQETGETLTATLLSDSVKNETAAALLDEQDTLEGEPGWFNSTYFDEIYHARTGYEHLHGLPTYETTHPPLGKVFISWSIAIFGMTPFGWRFAGALAGVLMLPGMYLLGKLLFKRRWGGQGAMLLLAFDLMHFTQTRIATIDSFVVLFIIWMVYFMLRWFLMDFFAAPLWKTLVPLGLSGLCMGLGIASKWTGCYAGAGLALIFFYGLYRRFREVSAAIALPPRQRTPHDSAAAAGTKPLLITLLSCLIFFVAVPLVIYYLSYIPYFAYNGGVTVKKVIEAAVGPYFSTGEVGGMLGYHSKPGLGMDHPFYSPWYEWPLIIKPMWYSSNAYEPAGMQMTIMVMGNPAVWWVGLAALFTVAALWVRRHIGKDGVLSLYAPKDDPRYALLLICFLAQYLPWIPVPRGTYIYHYFTAVPFIILCTVFCLDLWAEKREKAARIALIVLLTAALALFIAFFPYASGLMVSQKWLDVMKWFPNWLWY